MQDSGWRGAGESGFNSRMSTLAVTAVSAFDDNYLWLVHAPADPQQVLVVDPGDAAAVEAALRAQGLVLAGILVTHHHGDHVGGVQALAAGAGPDRSGSIPVFGPGNEDIDGITQPVAGGDKVELPALGLSFSVLAVPGHTRGHVAYAGHGVVFCGDTLFSGGCGRLFEGTPAQMHGSLSALAALPPDTRVYCAHEYTASNLRFALAVEPGNAALVAYAAEVAALRAAGQATVPTTVARELAINPFLRTAVPEVRMAAAAFAAQAGLEPPGATAKAGAGSHADTANHAGNANHADIAALAALRAWKNGFRG